MDDDQLIFSSQWEIDQLIETDTIAVGSGTSTIYTIPDPSSPPYYEVQFQPSASTKWFQVGVGSTNNVGAGFFFFDSYIDGASIIVRTPSAGTIRYHIWGDKVNH